MSLCPYTVVRLSTTFEWYFKLLFMCKVVKTIKFVYNIIDLDLLIESDWALYFFVIFH